MASTCLFHPSVDIGLDLRKLPIGYHRLVFAFEELTVPGEVTVVERIGEETTQRGVAEGQSQMLGVFVEQGQGVGVFKHPFPELSDLVKCARIGHDFPKALSIRARGFVVQGCFSRAPTQADLLAKTTFHVFREIIHVLLGDKKIKAGDEQVHACADIGGPWCPDFSDYSVLQHLGQGGGILEVPGQPVQMPAENNPTWMPLEVFQHPVEFRSARLACGLGLLVYYSDFKATMVGKSRQFGYLGLDREGLAVLGFGGFSA